MTSVYFDDSHLELDSHMAQANTKLLVYLRFCKFFLSRSTFKDGMRKSRETLQQSTAALNSVSTYKLFTSCLLFPDAKAHNCLIPHIENVWASIGIGNIGIRQRTAVDETWIMNPTRIRINRCSGKMNDYHQVIRRKLEFNIISGSTLDMNPVQQSHKTYI